MAYRTMLLVSIFVALLCGQVETAKADHSTSDLNHSYPEESLEEMGEELARVLADHLYEYLQRELNRLKKGTLESKEVLREKISQYEAGIKKNPNDAESRYILGQIYDEIGDVLTDGQQPLAFGIEANQRDGLVMSLEGA